LRKVKLLILALMLLLVAALPAVADQVDVYENQKLVKSVVFQIGLKKYFVNNQLPGYDMDVAPFIQTSENRTFVPVRFLGNALGIRDENIHWNGDTKKVTMTEPGFPVVEMTIGVPEVLSNGKPVPDVDVAPMLVDPGRTMLPARFTAEALGYNVKWDEKLNLVICWKGDPDQAPDVGVVERYLSGMAQGSTVNGYVIPANTDLYIAPVDKGGDPKGYIVFNILLKKGDLEWQYEDARSILSQTVDAETVDAVMSYARQASVRDRDNRLPPIKTFNSSNGMAVRVTGGDISVVIQAWPTD